MSQEIENIIIKNLDKLDSKIDKIEDSVNEVRTKVVLIEERQTVDRSEHKSHEAISRAFKETLDKHITIDNQVQANIFSELKNYNQLLDVHIEGVKTLKDLHVQNAEKIELYKIELTGRITALEAPSKAKTYLYKKYIKIAGVITVGASVILSVSKVIGLW